MDFIRQNLAHMIHFPGFCILFAVRLPDSSYTQDNKPPMPLDDAHLGGVFFLASLLQ